MKNMFSQNYKEAFMPLNFMNSLVKNLFHSIGFVEIGKSNKYFNPKSRRPVENTGVVLFNGFETSFSVRQDGALYLQVESMTRIVQDRSVLDFINDIYGKNKHLSRDEKRSILKDELIGRAIMANYGNSKHWIIEDIKFDIDYDN